MSHWVKMPESLAIREGMVRARMSDPRIQYKLGEQRLRSFLSEWTRKGRKETFPDGAPANPKAIHDVVDMTDPNKPVVIEVGTATPSRSEKARTFDQHVVWEQAKEAAKDLRIEGGDGRIYAVTMGGKHLDVTNVSYLYVKMYLPD